MSKTGALTDRQHSVRQSRDFKPQDRSRESSNAHMLLFSERDILNYIQEEETIMVLKPMDATSVSKQSVFDKLYNQRVDYEKKRQDKS